MYLDGGADPEIDAKIDPLEHSKRMLIGSDGNAATTFDGKIDEVAVFDRTLAARDIVDLYAISGMTPPPRPKPTILLGPKPSDAESRKKYAKVVLASKPIAFWRLHDESDRSAKDWTRQLPAKYEEGSTPLQLGTATPNFTGGRVKAQVPKLDNTYSVELWVRNELPVDSRPVTGYLFSRGVDEAKGAPGDSLGIGGNHANRGQLFVFNGNQRNEVVAGMTRIKPGSWSYVVMIRQGQRITVYLNGDPKPEIAADLPITYPAGCAGILLGGRNDNFANLQGMLEEVAVYDRALTPKEVKAHFDASGVKPVEKPAKAQTVQPAKPTPTDVGRALKTIHVREGFEVQMVAAEPLVMDPVAIDWGPDGKLWIVDMYRYMIEHPQWLPQNGQDELRPWFRSGEDRGRVYRIVRSDRSNRKVPRLADLSPKQLVAVLESPNGWQRDTAQRLLVRRKQQAVSEPLRELAQKSKQPLARLHALWTLDGLGALPAGTLEAALADSHAGVRRGAVRIASRVVVDANKLTRLVDDPDAKVRLELASTLGAYDDPAASTTLAELVIGSRDAYITAAAMSSLSKRNVSAVLAAVVDTTSQDRQPLLLDLVGQAVALGDGEVIGRVTPERSVYRIAHIV